MDRAYVLNGVHPVEGDIQTFFLNSERACALEIAKLWLAKGWKPVLYSKTYNGHFNVLLNYRNFDKYKKAA